MRAVASGHIPFTYEGPAARICALLDARLGDVSSAERLLRRALAEAETHRLAAWVAQILYDLGRVLSDVGRASEAEAMLESAERAALEIGMPGLAARAAERRVHATAVFQHMNLRTPRFLGWILMRPEAHALHHERGIHAYNYGSSPLWDAVFGTYRNPAGFPEQYGFWDGASARVTSMLLGRDVGEPETPKPAAGASRASVWSP